MKKNTRVWPRKLQKRSNRGEQPGLPGTKPFHEASAVKALAHEQTQIRPGFSLLQLSLPNREESALVHCWYWDSWMAL